MAILKIGRKNIEVTGIFEELINTPEMERLEHVSMYGYNYPKVCAIGSDSSNRLEHCKGVYSILKCFGISDIYQLLAGLLHDAAHTAFSHCADYIGDKYQAKQNSHDEFLKNYLLRSKINLILNKYKINLRGVLSENSLSPTKKKGYDLSADIIDYTLLRGMIDFGLIDENGASLFLSNLHRMGSCWFFKKFNVAKEYAELVYELNEKYFASFNAAVMLYSAGECLRYALEKKYLMEKDLYSTDNEVIKKIKLFLDKDSILKKLFNRMDNPRGAYSNRFHKDAKRVVCKSRIVNPCFLMDGYLMRLSDVDREFRNKLEEGKKPKEYYIVFNGN